MDLYVRDADCAVVFGRNNAQSNWFHLDTLPINGEVMNVARKNDPLLWYATVQENFYTFRPLTALELREKGRFDGFYPPTTDHWVIESRCFAAKLLESLFNACRVVSARGTAGANYTRR
uniref:Uncharacterized protein n=1 Tax=Culex nigripalpus nucleopolyhedrovirus TaxID=130556 RepID=Q99GR0_NPVCN|nr:unknown [Culex nigripalpus nucleopolyhedrovirus]